MPPNRVFEDAEYAHRLSRARERMRDCGIDCMLLFAQESLYYLFGYDGGGFVFFQCAVLQLDENKPTALLCRPPDVMQARHLFDVCETWRNANGANPARDLMALLFRAGVAGDASIGVETDTYGLTGRNHALLLEALAGSGRAEPKECSQVVRNLRLVKSAAEIVKMRRANELADLAIEAGMRAARSGVRDSVVSGAAMGAMVSAGGDLPVSWLCNSGPSSAFGRSITGGRVLEERDQIVMEVRSLN